MNWHAKRDGVVPGVPDAQILWRAGLTFELAEAERTAPHVWVKPGHILLDVPNCARFLVEDCRTIAVEPCASADAGQVGLFFDVSARGALIHQRRELPLHAAALLPPWGGGEAVAICGPSGAGKSTLAAELARRDWQLLADGATHLVTAGPGRVMTWPSRDTIKLRPDAVQALELEIAELQCVPIVADKYYLPVHWRAEPAQLTTVFELVRGVVAPAPLLDIAARMALLGRHTYRQAYVRPAGLAPQYAARLAETASACHAVQLPGDQTRSPALLADMIEEALGA